MQAFDTPLFRRCAFGVLAAAALFAPPGPGQNPALELVGVEKTEHFQIRFRPGSRAEASVDRVAALVEADLAGILAQLGLKKFPYTIELFLYDDVPELQRVTGIGSGGHSVPLASHVPYDNDQTRVHELVHVVAEKFDERGGEARNLFFAEGLANAVLRFVHGVHVDAVAAFYRQRGELPSLEELHAIPDFYQWLRQRPGFNAYDVAGSYMRYLLDEYGAARVRRYYKGVPAAKAFGRSLSAIEKGWHARLDAVKLRPGLRVLLEERAGGGATAADSNAREAQLGDEILGPASEWRALDRSTPLAADDPGSWERVGGVDALRVSGVKSQGDWSLVRLRDEQLGDAIVRCRAEALADCFGVQIQLGSKCQALVLRGQGTFIYSDVGGVGHDPRTVLGDAAVEIVLRRRGGRASVWVDGALVAEATIESATAPLAVGAVGGAARFTKIAVRRF